MEKAEPNIYTQSDMDERNQRCNQLSLANTDLETELAEADDYIDELKAKLWWRTVVSICGWLIATVFIIKYYTL